jgi:hypothetical protein
MESAQESSKDWIAGTVGVGMEPPFAVAKRSDAHVNAAPWPSDPMGASISHPLTKTLDRTV